MAPPKKNRKLNILIVGAPNTTNPFQRTLKQGLLKLGQNVEISEDISIANCLRFNIINIHWPESLRTNTLDISPNIKNLLFLIQYLKQKGVYVVFTRHNRKPHNPANKNIEINYRTILENADGIIHLGQNSFLETTQLKGAQTIIPHHIYLSQQSSVTINAARKNLGLSSYANIILVFGAIRTKTEYQRLKALRKVLTRNKIKLIATQWPMYNQIPLRKHPIKKTCRLLSNIYYKLHPCYRIQNRIIPEEYVEWYYRAADLVLLVREDVLNSGIIPQAFSFGRPVLGKKTGNLQELLEGTGNFTYDNFSSLKSQIHRLFTKKQLLAEIGNSNEDFAFRNWSIIGSARKYLAFFESLVNEQ